MSGSTSRRYPPELRERAVRMVLDHLGEYRSVYAACQAIGPKVGVVGVAGPGRCRRAARWQNG
jgi:transposase-like protein